MPTHAAATSKIPTTPIFDTTSNVALALAHTHSDAATRRRLRRRFLLTPKMLLTPPTLLVFSNAANVANANHAAASGGATPC